MKVLVWHVHGSWTTAFVQGGHEYLIPVVEGRGPDGLGRARTWDWPASVREVAPQADPVTRTFAVRVGLQDPPEAMRLGSTVVGTIEISTAATIAIPASALTQKGRSPAVWVVGEVVSLAT